MDQELFPDFPLLLVDDEESWLRSCSRVLKNAGINNIVKCNDSRNVIKALGSQKICLILLDLTMPKVSGEKLLPEIVANYPEIPVIILTGINELETAVRCMRTGAFDFLVKTDEANKLVLRVRHALELITLKQENARIRNSFLESSFKIPTACANIITRDPKMFSIFRYLEAVARSPEPLLITGESGVGKELIAQAVHKLRGENKPLVALNVAGLEDTLFADTLFGHVRGAFSGAEQKRNGILEETGTGTLFLDEIGDLSLASQVKLLRLLQEREYLPVGSDRPKKFKGSIILGTNVDLTQKQETGLFRTDLYYRLSTHHVHIPPLRERLGDLPLLIDHFIEEAANALGKSKPIAPSKLKNLLAAYHFPGNLRELRGLIYEAVLLHHEGPISTKVFEKVLLNAGQVKGDDENLVSMSSSEAPKLIFTDQLPSMAEANQLLIMEALNRSQGNQSIAATLLGISRQALNRRINKAKD